MLEEPHASSPPNTTPVDIDLYCLECGYNLRGLSGDPRRCPECGYKNPVGDLEIPAPLIAKQLKKMETAPAICLGSLLLAGIFGPLFMFAYTRPPFRSRAELMFICFVLLLGALVSYGVGVFRFRASCRRKVGWDMALGRYHFYGLGILAPTLLLGATAIWVDFHSVPTGRLLEWKDHGLVVYLGIWVAIFALIKFGGRWAHRRATELMQPLQREVAVEIARHELRKRMRQDGRDPFGG